MHINYSSISRVQKEGITMFTNCRSHFIHCNTLIYQTKLVRDCITIETYNTVHSKERIVLYILICNGIEWYTCLKNCWDFLLIKGIKIS